MKRAMIISWAGVAAWMAVIFLLSHQPGSASSQLSSGVTEIIKKALETILPDAGGQAEGLNTFVRKNAHFFAYFLFGILLLNALHRSGIRNWQAVALAFAGAVLYAMTDEFHQLFIEGRSGEWRDVGIDGAGAAAGLAFYLILSMSRRKVKKKS